MSTSKLYPPVIEGTIPAFYGTVLTVPFVMNKSVSASEFSGFSLKMKTIISGDNPLGSIVKSTNYNFDTNTVSFQLEQISSLYKGQFYKLQIAYFKTKYYTRVNTESEWQLSSKEDYEKQENKDLKDYEDEVGYYSTIGVVKYTDEPSLSIYAHGDGITYTGIYESNDYSEKVYTYNFTLVDNLGNIIETTGDKLHNGSADTEDGRSTDLYIIKTTLEINKEYYLTYSVKTVNGIEVVSSQIEVSHIGGVASNLRANVKCVLDEENGCIDISLAKPEEDESETPAMGTFYLLRASDEDGFKVWDKVLKFVLSGQTPVRHLWTDMSIKHGITYKYAVQQVNKHNLRSALNESDPIAASFDHMYLYDGERQLKIKYNPKVSTFKNTLLESKIDTIGSKYPFIFRNGNVNYKEFSISGLISYLSDDNSLFYNTSKLFENYEEQGVSMTNLTNDNITAERIFKLEALNWLTNGKPKLFRSPTEGNYIVRLMNSSMTPNDTVGRMLHTFTSTAYEIAENTYENLQKFNFVHANIDIPAQLRWKSINLKDAVNWNDEAAATVNILDRTAVAIKFEGMRPGDKIQMTTDTGTYLYAIGATGYYEINLENSVNIKSVSLPKADVPYMGILTYAYYSSEFEDSFDSIKEVQKGYVPCRQFIGAYDNLLDQIIDIKTELNSIDLIRFTLRSDNTMEVYKVNEKYYVDEQCTDEIDLSIYTDIFKVYTTKNAEGIWDRTIYIWWDGYNNQQMNPEDNTNTKVIINGDEKYSIDLTDSWVYELKNPPDITSIQTGAAIIAEISYTKKDKIYDIESTIDTTQMDNAKTNYIRAIRNSSTTSARLKDLKQNYYTKYQAYLEKVWEKIMAKGG